MGHAWEQVQRMSAKEAGLVFGVCVVDPTSVVGLRRLARERPGDWNFLLQAWVPKKVRLHDGLTLGEVLKAGVVGELFPKGQTGAETIRQARASARPLLADHNVERMLWKYPPMELESGQILVLCLCGNLLGSQR